MQSQQIQGQFVAAFKISFILSIVVTFPYIVHQIWLFIKPALSAKEIGKTRRSLGVVSLLFFAGVLFSYYFLVPIASSFLLSYSLSDKIRNVITIASVTGFVTFMSLATGLVFEMPVLIYILAKLGMVSSSSLIKRWRIALVVIFVIAAVATPSPDVFSQILLALPLMLLYVLSIFIARRVEKKRAMEEASGVV
jgi:sec-independent protein translocase protein TatC